MIFWRINGLRAGAHPAGFAYTPLAGEHYYTFKNPNS